MVAGPPERRGFRARTLDGTVRGQLGGMASLAWEASGLVCGMKVPKRGLEPAGAVSAAWAGLNS